MKDGYELETPCFVITTDPAEVWGPYRLCDAVRNVVEAPPPGLSLEIHVIGKLPLAERSIRDLYADLPRALAGRAYRWA